MELDAVRSIDGDSSVIRSFPYPGLGGPTAAMATKWAKAIRIDLGCMFLGFARSGRPCDLLNNLRETKVARSSAILFQRPCYHCTSSRGRTHQPSSFYDLGLTSHVSSSAARYRRYQSTRVVRSRSFEKNSCRQRKKGSLNLCFTSLFSRACIISTR